MNATLRFPKGFRLMFARELWRPCAERWSDATGGYWYVQAFGVCLIRDTIPPVSVAERGVW